jgi:transcriptional regulator with XRE-family HTH domain
MPPTARRFLRWSASELAKRAGVSPRTIFSIEQEEGVPSVHAGTLEKIQITLENAGIEIIPANASGGEGVRFHRN